MSAVTSRRNQTAFLGVLLAFYSLINLLAWLRNPPLEFGDTYRYFGSTLFDVLNPGITTTFVYTTVQDPEAITGLQIALFTIVWSLLAWLVHRALTPHWLAYALPILLLLISLTPPIWSWNVLLGSESLAISTGVLWLASMVWLAHREASLISALWLGAAAASIFMITRPQVLLVVLPVQALWLVWAWRRSGRAWQAFAPLGLLLPVTAFAMVRLLSLANDPLYRFRYAMHKIVDKPTSFREYVLERTDCPPMKDALNGGAPWEAMKGVSQTLIGDCPETYLFLQSDQTSLLAWTADKPFAALQQFIDVMKAMVIPIYTPGRALPEAVDSWFLPQWPVWILLVMSLAVGLVFAVLAGIHFRFSWWIPLGATTLGLAAFGFAYAVWGSDGIEHDRHLMPLTILAIVAAIAFPASLPARSAKRVDNTRGESLPRRH